MMILQYVDNPEEALLVPTMIYHAEFVIRNKKISKILKDKYVNPDLKNIQKKLEKIEKHIEKNRQDKRAKREKDRVFAQLRRIKAYLKE